MTRLERWLAICLTGFAIIPIWLVEYPPLQDYPYHLVRSHVLAHYHDPAFDYDETFVVSAYPAPYVLADWLVAGVGQFLSVPLAGKLVLTLYLALFPWSLIYLARSVGSERGVLGLLGFLLVYNWHFHMGFVSYVLSLPPALFAMGWWWRYRRELTARRLAVLALLVLATYLLHLYAFGVLGFVLVLLALVERRSAGALARTLVAFLPAMLLLAGAVARNVERAEGGQGPLLLLYGNLKRKLLLAAGALPSFSLAWETALFALGVGTVLALAALAWRRRAGPEARPSVPWLAAAGALVVLYLLLPDHVGRVFFVSNRVPLFVLLLGTAALPVPPAGRARAWAAGLLALLAVAHAATLTLRYREIDRRLADYGAALEVLPPDARVAFRADRAAMAEGRIAPAALFGGYHYLDAPGRRIPDLEHFVGTLRVVDYRREAGASLSTATIGSREELADLLGRPWLVGPGGLLVVVGGEGERVREAAEAFAFEEVLAAGPVTVRRKARPVFRREPEGTYFATGYADDGWDHLVMFRDPERQEGAPAGPELDRVFHRGWAAVYRRRPEAGADPLLGIARPAPEEREGDRQE